MKAILNKLRTIERKHSAEYGDFDFFGVLLREESPGKWDLVVSAPWLNAHQRKSTKLIDDELNAHLNLEEKMLLSRIVVLDPAGPMANALLSRFEARHGLEESQSETILDMQFDHVFVISAGRSNMPEVNKAS